MYRYMEELLELPIPKLQETMHEYLNWVKPLLNAEEFMKTQDIVAKFVSKDGVGEELQESLLKFAEETKKTGKNKSWLKPMWDKMYLDYRGPLVLNMNYYSIMNNEKFKEDLTPSEIAALAIVKATKTYFSIIDESMKPEVNRTTKLCMDQYKNTLKAVRVPKTGQDQYLLGEKTRQNNHVIVLHNNNIYKINVSNENGEILSAKSISTAIESILTENVEDQKDNIGAFTTADRETASEIYSKLMEDDKNRANIKDINEAVIAICMDEASDEKNMCKEMLLSNGKNRYFDKSGQIIVTKDCEIGFNNEHTGADGTTWFSIMDTIHDYIVENKNSFDEKVEKASYKMLIWNIDEELNKKLEKLICNHNEIANNIFTNYFTFEDFGKSHIKTLKISPDAFFHISLQLAQYRTFKCLRSTYEPVAMRTYREGRTECTRPVNEKVKVLVEQFDQCIDLDILKNMILEASNAHIDRIKRCQAGQGIERHMYGLNMMNELSENKISNIDLFSDKAYKKLKTDFISTSGLGSENIRCFGFGPVVEDGFGIGYGVKKDNISCTISCDIKNEKNAKRLVSNLVKSFNDIAKVLK